VVYKYGSTGKIIFDLHTLLKEGGHESIVCFGRGKNNGDADVYKLSSEIEGKFEAIYSRITGIAYAGCYFSTNKLLKIIESKRPDVVHLHCLNGHFVDNYKLLNFLKFNNYKTIITLHAELMYTARCGHAFDCEKWKCGCGNCPQLKESYDSWFFDRTALEWQLKASAFSGFNNLTIVAVSKWLYDRAVQSPFLKDKQFKVIGNGIDTNNVFGLKDYSDLSYFHISVENKILLHVSPSFKNPIKGGEYVLKLAKRLIGEKIKIIIIGYDGDCADLPDNVIAVRFTESLEELVKFYSMADLTILTSKKETFSMICAESLACGTPVVGFKAGAPEQITLEKYSEFVEYGDMDALESAVRRWIDKKAIIKEGLVLEANKKYSKISMYEKYMEIYMSGGFK
jgi:glycosyltransferase involved in cell wall biosynthesis